MAEGVDVVALTHNETSTGVMMHLTRPEGDALVVVDATSAAGGLPWVPDEVDVYYFAPQKCFAGDGGLWLAACSPAAVERIREIGHSDRWRPASLDLNIALDNSVANQTYNTPALATLVMLDAQVQWMLANGGLDWCIDRSFQSAAHLYGWAEAVGVRHPVRGRPDAALHVVATIDLDDRVKATDVSAVLRANGIVDTDSYRKLGRNQLRIAMFPAIEPDDVLRLTKCIDHVVGGCREGRRLNVLTTAFDDVIPLRRPIMVLALRGLFDIAEVATDAIDAVAVGRIAPVVASIDPDPFFDFTQERPQVEFDDDEVRVIRWPENEFRVVRFPGKNHDVVLMSGVEPHLRYATFADSIISVAKELGCEVVVTLGASPEAIPHTRPPQVVGSSTSAGLIRALGLSRPQYQGVTGLVGVLQERLDRAGLPAVSLRVGVPHYLGNAKHPQASLALLAPPGARARRAHRRRGAGRGHRPLAQPARRSRRRGRAGRPLCGDARARVRPAPWTPAAIPQRRRPRRRVRAVPARTARRRRRRRSAAQRARPDRLGRGYDRVRPAAGGAIASCSWVMPQRSPAAVSRASTSAGRGTLAMPIAMRSASGVVATRSSAAQRAMPGSTPAPTSAVVEGAGHQAGRLLRRAGRQGGRRAPATWWAQRW